MPKMCNGCEFLNDWLQLTSLKANKVEVIGNIHDNIELLKGNVE